MPVTPNRLLFLLPLLKI
ncbi:hypothetical protein HU200_058244 [Digitaria exilis]|uniref:Uncharacterized protein n=1 Tax=Digitaria exilis TaxID=1010633 RepID=A0A835E0S2_9POAL|nr:hypothetical protein HU200_058244 [Digitaria exilis]